jgi:hypothetical protein
MRALRVAVGLRKLPCHPHGGPKTWSIRFTNLHRVVPRSHNYADDCGGGRTRQAPRQR